MGEFAGVRPLVDDSEEIIRWVRRTGIYPIIHLIAIKLEVAERHPDLPYKLLEAFREAKRLSTKHLTSEQIEGNEREKAALAEDPYAYVVEKREKRTRAVLALYQIEQGFLKQAPPVESLFVRQAFAD